MAVAILQLVEHSVRVLLGALIFAGGWQHLELDKSIMGLDRSTFALPGV